MEHKIARWKVETRIEPPCLFVDAKYSWYEQAVSVVCEGGQTPWLDGDEFDSLMQCLQDARKWILEEAAYEETMRQMGEEAK